MWEVKNKGCIDSLASFLVGHPICCYCMVLFAQGDPVLRIIRVVNGTIHSMEEPMLTLVYYTWC